MVCVWQTSVVALVLVVVVRVSESGELHQPSTIIDQGPSASRRILAGGCCTGPSLVCSLLCWWAVGG